MKFNLVRIVTMSIFLVSAYNWGDWRNWRKYYHSMVFFGMGDLIYIAVFNAIPLWKFPPGFLIPPLDELLLIFTVFFPTTLLFLSNYPKKLHHQITHISLWIGIYMLVEIIDLKLGIIEYHNGWTLLWSLLHNTIQFPLIALHQRKPVLAWVIALIFLIIIMKIFNVPILVG